MKLQLYKFYILKSYLSYFLLTTFIFYTLSFILNILQEIVFLEEYNISIYYPVLLTFLNTPSLLYEIFPFIALITSQLFFINCSLNSQLFIFDFLGGLDFGRGRVPLEKKKSRLRRYI